MLGGLTWKIGLLVALPVAGAALALGSFAGFRASAAALAPTMNVAGRQRLRANELVAWAQMVAAGHEADRPGLEERIASFDETQAALRSGGSVDGHLLSPPTPELEPALARADEMWRQWRPRLLTIARGRSGDAETDEALAWLPAAGDALQREADAYVTALEQSSDDAMQREAVRLVVITAVDLLLLLAVLWLTRRQLVGPLQALTDAARRAQRGDFSARLPTHSRDELGVLAAAFNGAAIEVGRLVGAEARYHDVIEHLGDAVLMASGEGTLTYANAAAERMIGRPRAELVGSPVAQLMPEKYRAAHSLAFARAHGELGTFSARTLQVEVLRADGAVVPVDVSVSSHQVGGALLFTGILRDVTDRVQLTARMMQMDRMIAVGTLAAGVAHEINNPLAYVVANLGYLAEELPRFQLGCARCGDQAAAPTAGVGSSRAELLEVVREAQDGAERMRNIVRDLKSFSRSADDQRDRVDVRRLLESSLNMAWNEIRHRARLTKEFADVPAVDANESRLGQVCLNLLVNAAQAIPEGAAAANEIHVSTRRDGSSVVIQIRDTGCGIPPENLSRIFDPFFTTKPVGQGTGLGLAICQGILHDMGGSITVESVVGTGTTFRVTLPAAPETSASPVPRAAVSVEPAGRRGRILFIDDERAICVAMRRVLAADHDVTCAQNGHEALALLRDGPGFDVVFSDVMMPELDGVELYEALARERPGAEQELIFMTGGAFTPKARDFLERVPNLRLEKPFDAQTLRAIVRERLRRAG